MPTKQTIAKLYIFTSSSNASQTYQTLVYVDGSMSCDCPGWTFKRKATPDGQRTCKHTRTVEAGLGAQHATRFVSYRETETTRQPIRRDHEPELATRENYRKITLED